MPADIQKPENTEVYNIICDSIGIEPKANNGTLRLPLKPIGLHSDKSDTSTNFEVVDDPESTSPSKGDFNQGVSDSESKPDDIPATGENPPIAETPSTEETPASNENETEEALQGFWSYMKAKMKAAMEWAHGIVESFNKSGDGEAEDDGR